MEETKETKEVATPKLSYEQLEQVALQLQQRATVAENKLRTIDFASIRLTWLFKTVENKELFSEEFINKCLKEIEDLLTLENETSDKESENIEETAKV